MFGKKSIALDENSPEGAKTPKSFIETIISTTPVLLTVVATLLAGLSSSEMTQAQYYRSMAAQFQSKAGDQWGFFQAKRIRGSGLEQAADLLHPSGEPLEQALPALAARLQKHTRSAEKQTEQIKKLLAAGRVTVVDFVPSQQSLQQTAEKLLQALREKNKATVALQEKIAQRLKAPETKRVLVYLATEAIPETAADTADDNPIILQACKYVRERKPDAEIVTLLRDLPKDELQEAIASAEMRAGDFEKKTKPVTRGIDDLGGLVKETTALARTVYRAVQDLVGQIELATTDDQDPLSQASGRLVRTTSFIWSGADGLQADFKAGRHGFKARCYEYEARQNQSVAELYELQVRVNSAVSDRHRQRSKHFFYGMLAAQAGVTIATLGLALRHKSVLWGLASLTGLGAIGFSSYVYLCM
jgi:hypothetical protein